MMDGVGLGRGSLRSERAPAADTSLQCSSLHHHPSCHITPALFTHPHIVMQVSPRLHSHICIRAFISSYITQQRHFRARMDENKGREYPGTAMKGPFLVCIQGEGSRAQIDCEPSLLPQMAQDWVGGSAKWPIGVYVQAMKPRLGC